MSLRRVALGMFLVSATALAFEVALTRICSVLLQYHLGFAVVSMAVLGVGLGGFLGYACTARDAARSDAVGRAALLALGPAILLALVVILRLPFATRWPLLLFLVLPVFASAGAFQSLLLRQFAARAGWLYAADLAGGATGALLAVLALDALRGPVNAALVLAVLAAGFAWLWTGGQGRAGRSAPLAVAVALAAVVAQNLTGCLDVDYRRAPQKLITRMLHPTPQGTPRLLPALARWDAYSRVDVVELDAPRGIQRHVFIDGETPTPMLQAHPVAPNEAGVGIRDALAALPCRLRAPHDVLSIGSGGGFDVVMARAFGARHVDAVELNAGVLAVVDEAREFTGDVYRQPGVRLHHAEGRQFARRAPPASYDLMILALAQSLAGNMQEYALSENYLYTREALGDYLRVLRPDGAVAFLVSSSVVQEKLVRTAFDVLTGLDLDADRCVAAVSSRGEAPYDHLVIVRARPFEPAELESLGREVAARGYEVLQLPEGVAPDAPRQAPANLDGAPPLLEPASDEQPFFFHLEPRTPDGLRMLLGIAAVLLASAWIGLLMAARRPAPAGSAGEPTAIATALWIGGYFVLLGLAFLMVEVLVLQRTILVIGYPTLNLGLVLATFLVAAGCGSAASARIPDRRALRVVLLGLGLLLVGLMPLLGSLHAPLDRLPLPARCIALAALLFPFGFLMGLPFPTGVRLLPAAARPLIPWLWGLNGVASIAGSALVVAIALRAGFRPAGLLPAGLYLLAAVAASGLQARGTQDERSPSGRSAGRRDRPIPAGVGSG